MTTVAGTVAGYAGDGESALSAKFYRPQTVVVDSSGNMYIADTFNNRIRKITKSTGIISTVAGDGTLNVKIGDEDPATSAGLYYPYGDAVDAIGNVYIADTYNGRVRKI